MRRTITRHITIAHTHTPQGITATTMPEAPARTDCGGHWPCC